MIFYFWIHTGQLEFKKRTRNGPDYHYGNGSSVELFSNCIHSVNRHDFFKFRFALSQALRSGLGWGALKKNASLLNKAQNIFMICK